MSFLKETAMFSTTHPTLIKHFKIALKSVEVKNVGRKFNFLYEMIFLYLAKEIKSIFILIIQFIHNFFAF